MKIEIISHEKKFYSTNKQDISTNERLVLATWDLVPGDSYRVLVCACRALLLRAIGFKANYCLKTMFRVILNLFQDLCNDLTDAETLKSIQDRQVQQDFNV